MSNMEAELRSVLQAVLMGVCTRCDFVHGEALRPSGNSCLVQVLLGLRLRLQDLGLSGNSCSVRVSKGLWCGVWLEGSARSFT
mmetsp:Transcript_28233/g.44046  ORF Transcript_28233/g.44046 Transcript_28233/m.44046 type:complete len:83 (-) Transcript_28233:3046-3294(-)